MYITMLKSKIHRATVTDSNLDYEGSITIDENLMILAKILYFEKVDIYNINNGNRFSTYATVGKRNSGIICLNGAAARNVSKGDLIIIVSYALFESVNEYKKWEPIIVHVDQKNQINKAYYGNKR